MTGRNEQGPSALRYLYLALGLFFVAVAAVGAVLPVLPTTPFLILAAWCFARSSERLHLWLLNHPIFGKVIREWELHRVIPLSAKIMAIGAMSASFAYLLYRDASLVTIAGAGLVMSGGAVYILTKPSKRPNQALSETEGG